MISFIIIGKNIQLTAEICIGSIYKAMAQRPAYRFEVIYVDSRSTDKTMELVGRFPGVRKFTITGVCNAAIARNIGGKEAKGDSLFFLDGDMELQTSFLDAIYDEEQKLKYPFVSGDLLNHFYDYEGNDLHRTHPYFGVALTRDKTEYTTGGYFVIETSLWREVKGMRTWFRRGQDLDLGLRLSKKGYPLLRKKDLMAVHHTVSYFNTVRFWQMVKGGDYLYSGILIRQNFFNLYMWKTIKKTQSSLILLMLLIPLSIICTPYLFLLYPGAVFARSILKKDKQGKSFLFHFVSFAIVDFTILCSFLFFYPRNEEVKYQTIA